MPPPSRLTAAVRRDLLPAGALTSALWLSAVATGVLAAWILFDLQGWDYYTSPLGVRGYHPLHRLLRPSGRIAHWLGVAGWLLLMFPLVYMVRKRVRTFDRLGPLKIWLEAHIVCGLVGPAFVTFHTSFKFNGLISVAYWSMVIVALSGIVGRYLYVRIPKTIRGVELSHEQVVARAAELQAQLADTGLPETVRQDLDHFEAAIVAPRGSWVPRTLGEWWRPRRLGRAMMAHGLSRETAREVTRVASERAALVRRLATLNRTRRLFALWHVFHLPLVWLMFLIVAMHIGLALYLGYWPTL